MRPLRKIDCSECGANASAALDDYLCIHCRAKTVEYEDNEPVALMVQIAMQTWPGWVMVRESDVWVELYLVDRDMGASAFASAIIRHNGFAIWKHTANIYRLGLDGAVEDDPMPRDEFLAILAAGQV